MQGIGSSFGRSFTRMRYMANASPVWKQSGKNQTSGLKPVGSTTLKADTTDKVKGSFKRGGKVRKTGVYRLHEGERVLNSKQAKKYKTKR